LTAVTRKRFTLAEYHYLAELGFFSEDDRVELIRGEIMEMAAKCTPHSVCNSLLLGELYTLVGKRGNVRGQEPITLPPNSEPEPDVVVARRQSDHYLSAHPSPKDILLVIEVADSSLQYDQQTKLALYAEAGISDYWLFNLIENHLEVYSEPVQDVQGNSSYRLRRIILPDEVVALPCLPDLSLNLSSVFPSYPQQTQTSAYSGTTQ
jgi:Uma2 family endonuclease